MVKKESFEKICSDIKSLKIQGATNVAIAALKAFSIKPTQDSVKKLISLRPTEPCLRNTLKFAQLDNENINLAFEHLNKTRIKTAELASNLIKDGDIIYTHCHSSTVIDALKLAKKQGKKFKVNCTETRPFFQGRTTARDLAKAKIPVTLFVDSAMSLAIKEANICFIGADAITSQLKVINKIGSQLAVDTASHLNKPFYVLTDSWKFDPKTLTGKDEEIEKRNSSEVWDKPPKGVSISNYVFDSIDSSNVRAIISELGILSTKTFISNLLDNYHWIKK